MKVSGRSTSASKKAKEGVVEESVVPLKVNTGKACITTLLRRSDVNRSHILFPLYPGDIWEKTAVEGSEGPRVLVYCANDVSYYYVCPVLFNNASTKLDQFLHRIHPVYKLRPLH